MEHYQWLIVLIASGVGIPLLIKFFPMKATIAAIGKGIDAGRTILKQWLGEKAEKEIEEHIVEPIVDAVEKKLHDNDKDTK
jgi:hypothetical protein